MLAQAGNVAGGDRGSLAEQLGIDADRSEQPGQGGAVDLTDGTGDAQQARQGQEGQSGAETGIEQSDLPPIKSYDTIQDQPPLRIGLLAERGAAYLQGRIEPFRAYLQDSLFRPVEIVAFAEPRALMAAHIAHTIDYSIYSASTFAMAYAACGCLVPIVAPRSARASEGTYMILVVSDKSGIKNLAGLTGRTLALSSAKGAVPYHMGLNELRRSGLDPERDLASVRVQESPDKALALLEKGEVDAALVWASSPYNQDLFRTPGAISAYMQAKGGNAAANPPDFVTIWQSRPVAFGPHAVHKDIAKQDRADLITALVAMNKDAPDAYDAVERYYAGGFRAVNLDDYAPLIDIATSKK